VGLSWSWWQEAEQVYLLWRARQLVDEKGSGAVAVAGWCWGHQAQKTRALVDFAVHRLNGDSFPILMDYMCLDRGAPDREAAAAENHGVVLEWASWVAARVRRLFERLQSGDR
jgi:hypothetical protein